MMGYFIRAILSKMGRNKSDVLLFSVLTYFVVALFVGAVSEIAGMAMLVLLAPCMLLVGVYTLVEAAYGFVKEAYIQAKVNRDIEEKQNDQSR